MKNIIANALISNTATIGVHWIYDYKFLEKLSNKQSLLFMDPKKSIYDQANSAYFVYPNYKVGMYTAVGQIVELLYKRLKLNKSYGVSEYKHDLINFYKPGGNYIGYVESYGKKMIYNILNSDLGLDKKNLVHIDDHQLIGFAPYISCKALNIDSDKALDFCKFFSSSEDYKSYYKMFDILLSLNRKIEKQDIKKALKYAPRKDKANIIKSIEMNNTNDFISMHSGRGCDISQAIPLIIHIVTKCESLEKAIELNALVGGDSADRALIIGMLFAWSNVPLKWEKHLFREEKRK